MSDNFFKISYEEKGDSPYVVEYGMSDETGNIKEDNDNLEKYCNMLFFLCHGLFNAILLKTLKREAEKSEDERFLIIKDNLEHYIKEFGKVKKDITEAKHDGEIDFDFDPLKIEL